MEDLSSPKGYTCDCHSTGYYGEQCDTPTWCTWLANIINPSAETLDYLRGNFQPIWSLINNAKRFHDWIERRVVFRGIDQALVPLQWSTVSDYKTTDTSDDASYYARLLPPVPKDCPTHAGVWGPKKEDLPSVEVIVRDLFKREKFIPDPHKTSLLLPLYGQHFSHQFLKSMKGEETEGRTTSKHHIDLSQIYGDSKNKELMLRTRKDGKMKMQIINAEEWPPYLADVPVETIVLEEGLSTDKMFAFGHPLFNLFPGLLALSTIWLREHNRVADLLKKYHSNWDDERIFQTAKLVNRVQQLRISVNEYVKQLGGGNYRFTFEPTLMHGTEMQYGGNRIAIEFNDLYHWHALIPDIFHIGGIDYPIENVTWNNEIVLQHGLEEFFSSMSKQIAGQPTRLNFGKQAQEVAIKLLKQERALRMQPFNQYRKMMGLRPYESFEDLTNDEDVAKKAESLYKDIDAVELFPGMMLEKRRDVGLFSMTLTEIGIMCAFQGIFGDPLFSPSWWRPSTFGGQIGWQLVNAKVTLQELICRNVKGRCPTVSFTVPDEGHIDPHSHDNVKSNTIRHNEHIEL